MNGVGTRETARFNGLGQPRSLVEGIWQDEKQPKGSRIRTFDLLSPNRAATQAVYAPIVIRAFRSVRRAVWELATVRQVRMTSDAKLQPAAVIVFVFCLQALDRARSLTLSTMEKGAGHRLRQHQQSQEYANRHHTPHLRINRAEPTGAANRVDSHYRYSSDHHLNRFWRTKSSTLSTKPQNRYLLGSLPRRVFLSFSEQWCGDQARVPVCDFKTSRLRPEEKRDGASNPGVFQWTASVINLIGEIGPDNSAHGNTTR